MGAWYLISPTTIPFVGEVLVKPLLRITDNCPDVVVSSTAYTYNESYLLFWEKCKVHIQYSLNNSGNNYASDIKINCVIKNRNGANLNWKEETIEKLQAKEVRYGYISIDYACENKFYEHECTASYENPCQ